MEAVFLLYYLLGIAYEKLISMVAVAALLMTGCAKELKVTPSENLKVEYGEKLDNTKLFNAKESDENVKVDKVEGFDAKKLGEQEVTVTFTDGEREKEEKLKITVSDTKKPAIELKKESVSITAGDKLVLKDNIKSVKDPVDGDLTYSDKAVEKDGYYIDKGKLDTKKAGTYDVKVIAADKNGNKTEKSFKVNVKKERNSKENLLHLIMLEIVIHQTIQQAVDLQTTINQIIQEIVHLLMAVLPVIQVTAMVDHQIMVEDRNL